MPSLALENDTDALDLDYVFKYGRGIQALSGATGFGLPPVSIRWLEGAGDGALYRGRRVLPRDIDLPLLVVGLAGPRGCEVWGRAGSGRSGSGQAPAAVKRAAASRRSSAMSRSESVCAAEMPWCQP